MKLTLHEYFDQIYLVPTLEEHDTVVIAKRSNNELDSTKLQKNM